MKFIDMHCDTLAVAFANQQESIYDLPNCMLDIKRMETAGSLAQFFAIFMPPPGGERNFGLKNLTDERYIDSLLAIFYKSMTEHSNVINPTYDFESYNSNKLAGKMSGFLTFEDGRVIDGDLDKLKYYYDKGIRLITLTWNHENCFGFPNSTDSILMNKGLTEFGKESISYMNELGIIIDVSHLSDGGFYDVAELSRKPFIASHSNCRSISPHPRNLTDDMIRLLGNRGGVAGINFCPRFLSNDITDKDSKVSWMIMHIKKMIQLGGEDCIAIGSDFDGIRGNLEIEGVEKMPLLLEKIASAGISESIMDKIAYKNVERIIKEVL